MTLLDIISFNMQDRRVFVYECAKTHLYYINKQNLTDWHLPYNKFIAIVKVEDDNLVFYLGEKPIKSYPIKDIINLRIDFAYTPIIFALTHKEMKREITTKFLQAVNIYLPQKTTKKVIMQHLNCVPNDKCLIKDREEVAKIIANSINPSSKDIEYCKVCGKPI